MPLQKQIMSLPFSRGVDSKTDPFQMPPSKVQLLQNAYFYTPQSIRKRNGYVALSTTYYGRDQNVFGTIIRTTGSITSATGAWSRNGGSELLMADGAYLYSYSPSQGVVAWVRRTRVANVLGTPDKAIAPAGTEYIPAQIAVTPVALNNDFLRAADSSGVNNGLQAFVWQTEFYLAQTSIIDTKSGTSIITNNPLGDQTFTSAPTEPKVFSLGVNQFIYIVRDGTNRLSIYRAFDNGTGFAVRTSLSAPITDLNASGVYDATLFAGSIYVAYMNTSGDIACFTISINSARSAPVAITSGGTASAKSLAVWGSTTTNDVWFAWSAPADVRVKIFNAALNAIVLVETVIVVDATAATIMGIAKNGATGSAILYDRVNGVVSQYDVAVDGTVASIGSVLAPVRLASKMAAPDANQRTYYWVTYPSATEPTYFLIAETLLPNTVPVGTQQLQPKILVIAQAAQNVGGGALTNPMLPEINSPAANVWQTAIIQTDRAIAGIAGTTGVVSTQVTLFGNALSAELASTLHLTGGILWAYDGQNMVEHNFLLYPEITAVTRAPGAGFLSAGSYQYVIVFEWLDAQGQLHRSAPSVPFTVVSMANDAMNVAYKNMWLTNKTLPKYIPLNVGIYRTTANGTLFFRVNTFQSPLQDAFVLSITDATITYQDQVSDANLISREQLYTTGGEVANSAVPSALAVTEYRNRLIVVPADNQLSWWYSKEIIPTVPVEFSALFVQTIDERGGNITAVQVMDDKLVFFKSGSLFVVVGNGPAPNGTQNDYTQGQLITTDTGALYGSSVVTMPDGIMFQSVKGIEILERNLVARYIGADVESFVQGAVVTSATLVASLNQVRFMLSSGVCVVYDYYMKDPNTGIGQWSVFTNHASIAATPYNGIYVYAQASGQLLAETPGSFTDNGSFIQIMAKGAWLSLAGLQGFQRIYKAMVLGTWESQHSLVVGVAYDFDPTIVQTETIDATSPPMNQYQWRVLLNRQKCEAIQFTVSDSQVMPYGEGLRISALALEAGVKAGLQKSPQTKTYG